MISIALNCVLNRNWYWKSFTAVTLKFCEILAQLFGSLGGRCLRVLCRCRGHISMTLLKPVQMITTVSYFQELHLRKELNLKELIRDIRSSWYLISVRFLPKKIRSGSSFNFFLTAFNRYALYNFNRINILFPKKLFSQ